MVQPSGEGDPVDLAVIGAGIAGVWTAHAVKRARPDWSVTVFERSARVGGRLRSIAVPGLAHPIELGGMRYLAGHHHLVDATVNELGLASRPWDGRGGPERTVLRGVIGGGPGDPASGRGYQVAAGERGRSAVDLTRSAFRALVPDADVLDDDGWARTRATHEYRGRPLTDWTISDALATVLSPEAHVLSKDAFGYDSGPNLFNAGDAMQYMTGTGNPVAEARSPVAGMESIPQALAAAFRSRGGDIRLEQGLQDIQSSGGLVRLGFAGDAVTARRVVLTMPMPGLRRLASTSPLMGTPAWRRVLASVRDYPAAKFYLWYDRPWWRGSGGVPGIRTTTDLPNRKIFYLDDHPDAPAAMIASYTDGRHTEPWVELAGGVSDGQPAPPAMLERTRELLQAIHPTVPGIPDPLGSAFMHWGSDPLETGWTFWAAGDNSDEIMRLATQPDPEVPVYTAGEAFSRSQAWAEGSLESAGSVVERLLAT